MSTLKWTYGTGNVLRKGVFTGSLVESSLHAERMEIKKQPGESFTVEELLENNRCNRNGFFAELLASLKP